MNCCDYDCTQGHDCPARTANCPHCRGLGFDASGMRCDCQATTRPAKVGRRMQAAEALPPSTWRAALRGVAEAMLLVVAALLLAALALGVTHA